MSHNLKERDIERRLTMCDHCCFKDRNGSHFCIELLLLMKNEVVIIIIIKKENHRYDSSQKRKTFHKCYFVGTKFDVSNAIKKQLFTLELSCTKSESLVLILSYTCSVIVSYMQVGLLKLFISKRQELFQVTQQIRVFTQFASTARPANFNYEQASLRQTTRRQTGAM